MMKVFVSIKLRCMIGKFDTMLWGLMRRAFTLFLRPLCSGKDSITRKRCLTSVGGGRRKVGGQGAPGARYRDDKREEYLG